MHARWSWCTPTPSGTSWNAGWQSSTAELARDDRNNSTEAARARTSVELASYNRANSTERRNSLGERAKEGVTALRLPSITTPGGAVTTNTRRHDERSRRLRARRPLHGHGRGPRSAGSCGVLLRPVRVGDRGRDA